MRVLFWTDVFWPTIGGIEVLSVRLLTALRERGHEFLVVASNVGLDLPEEAEYCGIPIRRFPFTTTASPAGLKQLLKVRQDVARLRQEFAPDLVHVACIAPGAMFELETAKAHPAPLLVTIQQSTAPIATEGALGLLTKLVGAADWIACCSEAMRNEVQSMLPEVGSRSSVIINAMEAPALEPSLPPAGRPRLLGMGRLAHQKAFDVALTAVALLRDRSIDGQLAIAGGGPLRESLEAQADALGIRDRVEFLGWIVPDRIPAEINRASMVLVPSRHEPFGLVALEAALMARPVVASRVGGLREVVLDGETGLMIPPEDPHALAGAIARLLDDPEMARRMGQAARAHALASYSWDAFVDAYDTLYTKLHKESGHVAID